MTAKMTAATGVLLGTLFVASAGTAAAQHIQTIHGSACMLTNNWTLARCPFVESDEFTKPMVNYISLFGYDAVSNAGTTVRACITLAGGSGGFCGPSVSTTNSFVGSYWLPVDPAAFHAYPTEYGHLYVTGANVDSIVYGYDFVE